MQDRYNNVAGDWIKCGTEIIGGGLKYFGSVEERKAAQKQAEALEYWRYRNEYQCIEIGSLLVKGFRRSMRGGRFLCGSKRLE